jgi:hypothetical protein
LLVVLCGCKRCDDDCVDGECIAYDPTTSTGDGVDAGTEDNAASETMAAPTSEAGSDPGSTGSSGGGPDDQCFGTDECGDGFCVAPYADNVRGAFDCVVECVGPDEEGKWCFDDAACCDPLAHCTIRGYCEADAATTTSTGDSSSGSTGESGGGSSSSSG